tara:strand:- start:200 stop:541 length:342 start_codon:yes stop_codon:yes gene_type:complete
MEVKSRIDFEDFITAWETSGSVGEVCSKLEMSKQNAYARATKYRGEGVPLKKFVGGGGRAKIPTVDKLAVLARVRGVDMEVIQSESTELLNRPKKSRGTSVPTLGQAEMSTDI